MIIYKVVKRDMKISLLDINIFKKMLDMILKNVIIVNVGSPLKTKQSFARCVGFITKVITNEKIAKSIR